MDKINEKKEYLKASEHTGNQKDLWKALNEARFPSDRKAYNGSFDDGNHPGEDTEYTAVSEKESDEISEKEVHESPTEELGEIAFYVDEEQTDKEIFDWIEKHQDMLPIKSIVMPKALQ
jgi:hypothetical protein